MTATPALGSAGWFTTEGGAALLGGECTSCGTVVFPRGRETCPDPACEGSEFTERRLASTGRVWSYTDARYQPPPPFVPPTDPYEPFVLAAVELSDGIVVLGQMVRGTTVDDLQVGREVRLVVDALFTDDEGVEQSMWKWELA